MDDQVTVESGALRGVVSQDAEVRAFKGIPYAAPPVGELRWRPPQRCPAWSGVRDAVAYGPSAPQTPLPSGSLLYAGDQPMSESCLYLNVWTGPRGFETHRPVMVWLHFGAYQFGSGSDPIFDGAGLARAGATVVTLNYRLGRLGFLALPGLTAESEHRSSGNYGLLDQVAALQWIQRNIAEFGGDPGNVTVFGVSAGAHSVNCLRSSPLAAGLFHRAITQSGIGFSRAIDGPGHPAVMQTLGAGEEAGLELCEMLGTQSPGDLRALTVEEINGPQLRRSGGVWNFDLIPPEVTVGSPVFDAGYPVIDGWVMPKAPRDIFEAGQQCDVPLLAGNVANESSGLPYIKSLGTYESAIRQEYGDFADELLRLYPATTDAEARRASGDLYADRTFTWSTWTVARLDATTGATPVFHYRFMREPPLPADAEIIERDNAGAYHTGELPYVFSTFGQRAWPWEDADRALNELMSGYWLNFARNGDPNGGRLPAWPRFEPGRPTTLCFGADGTVSIGDIPNLGRLEAWSRYYSAFDGRALAGAPPVVSTGADDGRHSGGW